MNKENRPAADLFPESATEGDPLVVSGLTAALVGVTWVETAPRAVTLLDQYTGSDFMSNANSPGGRHRVELAIPEAWKAISYWIEDPTANPGKVSGYQLYNVDFETDGPVPVSQGGSGPRSVDLSTGFTPPLVLYVSAYRHEKRLLKITPYPAFSGGVPSGTPFPTLTITLTPPPSLTATVTCESPDGFYNPRWRKISFAMSPVDGHNTFGSQPFFDGSYFLSATRIKTDLFLFPNATQKYVPGQGRDVFLWRPGVGAGFPGRGGLLSRQYENQGQFRRVMEVGNDGAGNGFIEYERPFCPALAAGDGVWVVDRCVMARVVQTPHRRSVSGLFDEVGEYEPQVGPLYLDTWHMPVRHYTNYEMPSPFRPGNVTPTFLHNSVDWQRRYVVEAYAHDANYPSDDTFEDVPGASGGETQDAAAAFPESPMVAVSLNAQHWPVILAAKLRESMTSSGMLRVELDGVKGDVARWRLYVRDGSGTWPTVDGSQLGTPDELYFYGEFSRWQESVDTSHTLSGQTNVILVPVTSVGEWAGPCRFTRAAGPETAPIVYNLRVTQADAGGVSKHLLTWNSNGAAQDITYGFRIEHVAEHHKGRSHGENPSKILLQVNNGLVAGTFTHSGDTPGATIDSSRGLSTNEYLATHHYYLYISIPDGLGGSNDVLLGHCQITDSFSDAREADVSLGTLHARVVRADTEVDDAGRTTSPLAISVACTGAVNAHFLSGITQNSAFLAYEYTLDGGTTWHHITTALMDRVMSATHVLHSIWGKKIVSSGGTVYTIQHRAFYQRGTDFGLGIRRALVTSTPFTLRLADAVVPNVTPAGPF
jgi:hypothetical protein